MMQVTVGFFQKTTLDGGCKGRSITTQKKPPGPMPQRRIAPHFQCSNLGSARSALNSTMQASVHKIQDCVCQRVPQMQQAEDAFATIV